MVTRPLLPIAEPAELQQIGDQRHLLLCPRVGPLQHRPLIVRRHEAIQDQPQIALDGRDGRLKLVRHQPDERGLGSVDLFELGLLGGEPQSLGLDLGQAALLAHEPPVLQPVLDRQQQIIDTEGLGQEVVCALLDGVDGHRDGGVASDDDADDLGVGACGWRSAAAPVH